MEKLEYNQIGNSQRLGFKLIVSAINEELHAEFVKAFEGFPEVEVVFQRFEDTDFDCVVSAANSFGLMDGGVDQCITDLFGVEMMHRVQRMVIDKYAGEQPVGTSEIVAGGFKNLKEGDIVTKTEKMQFVAHTPTMRVPRDVMGSDNAYRAMKAALLAVKAHNRMVDLGQMSESRINSVVTPGLATLTGRIPYDKAAKQMALATYHVMNPPNMIDWYFASERDAQIQESR
jgi:O-acetyl-ADP-ribose deacetylase (regulator of RNase III)